MSDHDNFIEVLIYKVLTTFIVLLAFPSRVYSADRRPHERLKLTVKAERTHVEELTTKVQPTDLEWNASENWLKVLFGTSEITIRNISHYTDGDKPSCVASHGKFIIKTENTRNSIASDSVSFVHADFLKKLFPDLPNISELLYVIDFQEKHIKPLKKITFTIHGFRGKDGTMEDESLYGEVVKEVSDREGIQSTIVAMVKALAAMTKVAPQESLCRHNFYFSGSAVPARPRDVQEFFEQFRAGVIEARQLDWESAVSESYDVSKNHCFLRSYLLSRLVERVHPEWQSISVRKDWSSEKFDMYNHHVALGIVCTTEDSEDVTIMVIDPWSGDPKKPMPVADWITYDRGGLFPLPESFFFLPLSYTLPIVETRFAALFGFQEWDPVNMAIYLDLVSSLYESNPKKVAKPKPRQTPPPLLEFSALEDSQD